MKLTTLKLLLSFILVALIAMPVYAAVPIASSTPFAAVAYTVHNLSHNDDVSKGLINGLTGEEVGVGRRYAASSLGAADQVCVFCHTPHNASPSVPLWNKINPAAADILAYRLYTSSPTLSSYAKGAQITANSVSLLCLSCHDGKTAINVLHNSSYSDATTLEGDAIIDINGDNSLVSLGLLYAGPASVNGPNLGAVRNSNGQIALFEDSQNGHNFTDDHPIGFSYGGAAGEKLGQFKSTPDAGIRLFDGRIECSSCHDPHVYYGAGLGDTGRVYFDTKYGWGVSAEQKERTPFLSVSNKGSQLCLGCHIK